MHLAGPQRALGERGGDHDIERRQELNQRAPHGLQPVLRHQVGDRVLVARPLPDLPGERLDVLLGRVAAGKAASDPGGDRHRRPEQAAEVGEQLGAAPGRRDLLHLVTERLELRRRVAGGLLAHRVELGARQRRVERQADLQRAGRGDGALGVRTLRGRRPARVAELGAGEDVQRGRRVDDRARQHAVPDEEALAGVGTDRDAAAGGLEADQATAGGGDADRPAAVVAVSDRDHAGRHGGRRAAARASRRAVQIPRVARRSEPTRLGRGQDPHLGQRGLADDHKSGVAKPSHQIRVVVSDQVPEQVAAHRQRHPGDRAVVLDRDRHAGERPLVARLDLLGDRHRRIRRNMRERVDLRLQLLDPRQRLAHQFGGAQLAGADQARELGGRREHEVGHGVTAYMASLSGPQPCVRSTTR